MTIRVNVDTSGLEAARSALNQAEEMTVDGFDHVSDVLSRLTAAVEGVEEFRHALLAALDSATAR